MYNPLIEKMADQSIDIFAVKPKELQKGLKLNVITTKNFMLQIRNGHNFYTIRFVEDSVIPHSDQLDGIIALNKETEKLYREKLTANGFILGDGKLPVDDPRVIMLGIEEMEMVALLLRNTEHASEY